jgi:transcriptional regulator with XRE-family HTH domain
MNKNKELGAFVRAHRERISPGTFGLSASQRRRTPGLRREELASMCGMSTTWLTWMEQGRPVSVSSRMLARLSDVLCLSPAERNYLFQLADKVDPERSARAMDVDGQQDAGAIVDVIQSPAYVLDRQWNAIAWNDPAARLFRDWLGAGGPDADRNLLRYMFLQDTSRAFVVDWPDRAGRLVAEFRAECGKAADTPPVSVLIDTLLAGSAEFSRLWAMRDVVAREGGRRAFLHPVEGLLAFNQMSFQFQGRPDLKLTVLRRSE